MSLENNASDLTLINDYIQKSDYYQDLRIVLDKTIGFILFLVGFIGNMCILYLMKSKKLFNLTISVYLITLAISDSIALLFENLIIFIDLMNSSFSIQQVTECRIYYLNQVARLVSAWTVVNISLDRFVSVYYPKTKQKFLSKKSCIIRVVIIVTVSILVNLHYLVMIKTPIDFHYDCYADDEFWFEKIWPPMYAILYSLIPSILIIAFNSLIIHKTVKSKKNLNKIAIEPTSTNQRRQQQQQQPSPESHHSSKKLNLTVIFICISFVLLTLPGSLINIGTSDDLATGGDYSDSSFLNLDYQKARSEIIYWTFIRRLFEYLMDLNNAINFFLYVLTSNLFRNEFYLLLKLKFNLNLVRNTRFSQKMTNNNALFTL